MIGGRVKVGQVREHRNGGLLVLIVSKRGDDFTALVLDAAEGRRDFTWTCTGETFPAMGMWFETYTRVAG